MLGVDLNAAISMCISVHYHRLTKPGGWGWVNRVGSCLDRAAAWQLACLAAYPKREKIMTTLATRRREVALLEGFEIEVWHNGTKVDDKKQGFPSYEDAFSNKLKDAATVAEWKVTRFNKVFKDHTCRVLNGDGRPAHGNTELSTVRASYNQSAPTPNKRESTKRPATPSEAGASTRSNPQPLPEANLGDGGSPNRAQPLSAPGPGVHTSPRQPGPRSEPK